MEIVRLLAQPQHLVCQLQAALGTLAPDLAHGNVDAVLGALFPNQVQLGVGILGEPVDGHHRGQAEHLGDVLHVL